MPNQPPFRLESDPTRNLLRITYLGNVTAAAVKSLPEQAALAVPQLRPGFTVLTDLTGLESMALACVPYVTALMDVCKAHGIGSTVRVIPDPRKDIGLKILAVTRYGTGVRIITCKTLAEAEAVLKA